MEVEFIWVHWFMGSGVHCIGSSYWFIVLVHCIGSLYWFLVLVHCIGSLYSRRSKSIKKPLVLLCFHQGGAKVFKKSNGFIYVFSHAKSDSHSGRTVKKIEIMKKLWFCKQNDVFLGRPLRSRAGWSTWPLHGCVCFCVPTLLMSHENP